MKRRWYLSTLIVLLTIFGAVYQQQLTVPNQEIILLFENDEVTSNDVDNAIAIVTNQLQTLGIHKFNVSEEEHGRLKITYYSATDVASIKKLLSKEKKVKFDYWSFDQNGESNNFPTDENSINYDLAIYEIHNSNDLEWDLDGNFVLEFRSESDRFNNPNVIGSFVESDLDDRQINIADKVQGNIALAIDNTSYKIPEVRAGPALLGNRNILF